MRNNSNYIFIPFMLVLFFSYPVLCQYNGHSDYYIHKATMFEILPNTPGEIIFLGDSITDRCEWNELFPNLNVKNRGLSADETQGVLDRLQEVTASQPDKIFLMIGVNDLRHNISPDTIFYNYEMILKRINNDSPETKIFIQSILPVNEEIGTPKANNKDILKLNAKLRELSQLYHLKYIDLFSKISDENDRLEEKYSLDGLHLNGSGYILWKSLIEKFLK